MECKKYISLNEIGSPVALNVLLASSLVWINSWWSYEEVGDAGRGEWEALFEVVDMNLLS